MHFLGLNGMPRRTFTYDANMGWNTPNFIASIGAFVLGIGMFTYFAVMAYTFFKGKKVGKDVWDARTLEWSLPNPRPSITSASSRPCMPVTHFGMRSITKMKSPKSRLNTPRRRPIAAESICPTSPSGPSSRASVC